MVLNKKGQVVFYLFMVGLVVIILALNLIKPTVDIVQDSRNETMSMGGNGLNCTVSGALNNDLSIYNKATCYVTDLIPFYFIGILLCLGGAIITAKLIMQ